MYQPTFYQEEQEQFLITKESSFRCGPEIFNTHEEAIKCKRENLAIQQIRNIVGQYCYASGDEPDELTQLLLKNRELICEALLVFEGIYEED